MSRGSYTFYFIPTILYHEGDIYKSIEIAWLRWHIGIRW